MKDFEIYGFWWLPNKKDEKWAGALKYDKITGARLNLIHGQLNADTINMFEENIPIINGLANNAEFTLINCEPSVKRTFDVFTTYKVNEVVKGNIFDSVEEIESSTFYIELTFLEEWLNQKTFKKRKNPNLKEKTDYSEIILDINPDRTFKFELDEDIEIEIHPSFKYNYSFKEFCLSKYSDLQINCKYSQKIEEVMQYINHIINFICFATQRKVFSERIFFSNKSTKDCEYIRYNNFYEEQFKSNIDSSFMLFNFQDINEKIGLEVAFQNWFKDVQVYHNIFWMFFLTEYSSDLFHFKFLSIAHALDAFTNLYFLKIKDIDNDINKVLSSKEFGKRKEILISSLPSDELKKEYTTWLDDNLSNKLSFKDRIELVLKKEFIEFFEIENSIKLIKLIVTSRNSLSHGHIEKKRDDNKYLSNIDNFIWLYYAQKMIFSAFLLRRIGFTSEQTKTQLLRNSRYKMILEREYVFSF
jgi:hypothetical protein